MMNNFKIIWKLTVHVVRIIYYDSIITFDCGYHDHTTVMYMYKDGDNFPIVKKIAEKKLDL